MIPEHPFLFLSTAFSYPEADTLQSMSKALCSLAADLGMNNTAPGELAMPSHLELQAEYVRLFINAPGGVAAPPYASVYIQGSGILMQQGHDQALGFYRQAGLEPDDTAECNDHLSHELAFVGILIDSSKDAILADFLHDHLLQWYPRFLHRLQEAEPCPFYHLLGRVTDLCLKYTEKEVVHEQTTFS